MLLHIFTEDYLCAMYALVFSLVYWIITGEDWAKTWMVMDMWQAPLWDGPSPTVFGRGSQE